MSNPNVGFTTKRGHRRMSGRCPLYPQKRTLELSRGMSALCHKQTPTLATGVGLGCSKSTNKSALIYRGAILPIHPLHFVAFQISTDGNPNCRKEEGLADLGK